MILFLLAYLGGVLTIVSPCILPVLPFVFARADRPFLRSGLPMLVGMAATFAAVATLAAVGGGWAVPPTNTGASRRSRCWRCSASRLLFPALVRAPDAAAGRARRAAVRSPPITGAAARLARRCRRCCSASRRACCGRPAPGRCSA